MIKSLNCKTILEIVSDVKKEKELLNVCDILKLIDTLRLSIDMHNELNILDDIKSDVFIVKNELKANRNLLISKENLSEYDFKDLTINFINMLEEQCLLLVVNENLIHIDINYDRLIRITKDIADSNCLKALIALKDFQSVNLFNIDKTLNLSELEELHKKYVVSADFEKNEELFKFLCSMLRDLEILKKAYSTK